MKLETAKKIAEHLNECGEDVRIHEGYSGRAMYGEKTTGLVVAHPTIMFSIGMAAETLSREDAHFEPPESVNFDSLGLDVIVY